jgi:peroxiredoxin
MKKYLKWVFVFGAVLFAIRNLYVRFIAVPDLPVETTVLTDGSGAQFDLRTDNHPYILISYVQSWCGDCIREIPSMMQLQKDIGTDKIQVVLISDEPNEKIKQIEKRFNGAITVYQSAKSMSDMNIHVFPTTFLIDSDRKILLVKKEGFDWNGEEVKALVQ